MNKNKVIDNVIDNVLEQLQCNVASWPGDMQYEIYNNESILSLYVNDYVRDYIDMNNIDISEGEIEYCIKEIITLF